MEPSKSSRPVRTSLRRDKLRDAASRIEAAVQEKASILDLSGLELVRVPESVSEIANLEELQLGNNNLEELPDSLSSLQSLHTISIRNNPIVKFPGVLLKLPRLKVLEAFETPFKELPQAISELSDLETIRLQSCGLTSLPESLSKLTKLQFLFLNGNPFVKVPECIFRLSSLELLDLQGCKLGKLPDCFGTLKRLEQLWLNNNYLSELPASIGELSSLKTLSAWNNQLQHLPQSIGNLRKLERLEIWENHIRKLPWSIGNLVKLQTLEINRNRLERLPSSLKKLRNLYGLYLHDNPALGLPQEVLGPVRRSGEHRNSVPGSPNGILDYYFSIAGSNGVALREVKIILVGRGEVGKSSMADVLQGKNFVKNRPRTDGISISEWGLKLESGSAKALVWDFGGQEIMHGTHQFFLTRRSIYIVMIDGRHDRQKQDAEYWLKLVRAFGGDSEALVLMNRQQEHPFDVDRPHLAKKYGISLSNFFLTECEQSETIAPVCHAIERLVEKILATEEKFPSKCWAVKDRLDSMKSKGEDYLSDQDYNKICKRHKVSGLENQQKLLERLADLGTVVSFPHDGRLSAFSVLNPEWVTDGIYRVITNAALKDQRHGILCATDLRVILPQDRWPKAQHLQYLLDLMQKFELCFPIDGTPDVFLVPELLRDETPLLENWDPAKCIVFLYKYNVLPHGVLPRFITRTNELSVGNFRWRTGVVLTDEGAEAVVKADYEEGYVSIWIRGEHAVARRSLLKVVRHHFDVIHSRIKDLDPEELIAVPGEPDVLIPYKDLVIDEFSGITDTRVTIRRDGTVERRTIKIAPLLNGFETRKERFNGLETFSSSGAPIHMQIENLGELILGESMKTTNKQEITGGTFNAPVAVNQTFTNCFQNIGQVKDDQARTLLTELVKAVEVIQPQLDDEARKKAERQVKLLTEEAAQPKPDKSQLEVSGKGLIEAAKTCASMAGPVVAATKTVLGLFGVPLP